MIFKEKKTLVPKEKYFLYILRKYVEKSFERKSSQNIFAFFILLQF